MMQKIKYKTAITNLYTQSLSPLPDLQAKHIKLTKINKNDSEREWIKKNGAVYTPSALACFVANKTVSFFLDDLKKNMSGSKKKITATAFKKIRILDPACGAGELLFAAADALQLGAIKEFKLDLTFDKDLAHLLTGIDLDKDALDKLSERIDNYFLNGAPNKERKQLIQTNALFPFKKRTPNAGWERIKNAVGASAGFDLVIANPPWGADMQTYESKLQKGYFQLYKGQCDTSDLFVELILSITKPNGYFALIIPDSLFNGGRDSLRKLLLAKSEIKFIGRMGEKLFPGINRGCAVVICKKSKPNPHSTVECFRLLPMWRKKILQNKCTFAEPVNLLSHKVPQARFRKNEEHLFDIDLHEDEVDLIRKIKKGAILKSLLTANRGVELSKTGKICKCTKCKKWMPLPSAKEPTCLHCHEKLKSFTPYSIISRKKRKGYSKLFAGESFSRYSTDSELWIDTQKKGINYKGNLIYEGPKILVRKTGVSITATIDYSNTLTNQVVYILKKKDDKTSVPIEALLALLNSRVIAYFLLKKFGEAEWRSHPYLTQGQILNLPIPQALEKQRNSLRYISSILKELIRSNKPITTQAEAEIEKHVAALYGLNEADYSVMYKAFESVEDLLPFRKLKALNICDIF